MDTNNANDKIIDHAAMQALTVLSSFDDYGELDDSAFQSTSLLDDLNSRKHEYSYWIINEINIKIQM